MGGNPGTQNQDRQADGGEIAMTYAYNNGYEPNFISSDIKMLPLDELRTLSLGHTNVTVVRHTNMANGVLTQMTIKDGSKSYLHTVTLFTEYTPGRSRPYRFFVYNSNFMRASRRRAFTSKDSMIKGIQDELSHALLKHRLKSS